ncbi:MAG: AraC family transcriptional regulator [Acidobacteriota bacterium]
MLCGEPVGVGRSPGRPPPASSIALTWQWGLALTPGIATNRHRHHAIEIVIDASGATEAVVDDRHLIGSGLVIGPRVPHSLPPTSTTRVSLLTGPLTPIGRCLSSFLDTRPARVLSRAWVDGLLARLPCPSLDATHRLLARSVESFGRPSPLGGSDPRVLNALRILRRQLDQPSAVATLARSVHLSERRLCELFHRDVGMPVRSYRRWLRIRAGARLALRGSTLTTAAHAVGFTDLAAFSNAFKETLGFPPSTLHRWAPDFRERDRERDRSIVRR